MGALLVEFGLHRVKKLTIEDGGLLAGKYFAFEHNLADEEPIAEKMGKRTSGERDSANRAPGLEQSLWPRSVLAVGLCARTHRLGHCPVFDSKINRGILGAHARGGLPRG